MRTRTLAGLLTGVLLAVTGCAGGGSGSGDAAEGGGDAPPAASSAGPPADLGFEAVTLEGGTLDGEDLAGTPTVFWFWAPWCPTCRAQAPAVSDLALKYDGVVEVVGVGGLADEADIRDYAATVEGPRHLVDPKGEIWQHFGVTAQSTYLVVDADGSVVADGYLDDPVLAERVAALAG